MSIKTVNVFLNHYNKKISVGKLAYKDGVIYFEYSAAFLDSKIQLSPYKLPLRRGVFVCDDNVFEGLFGLFGDSLPDGWGRLLLDRHFLKQGIKYSEITPLDRLSYIGKYGTGALSFEPIIDNILIKDTQELHLDELSSASMEILRGTSEKMIDSFLSLGLCLTLYKLSIAVSLSAHTPKPYTVSVGNASILPESKAFAATLMFLLYVSGFFRLRTLAVIKSTFFHE